MKFSREFLHERLYAIKYRKCIKTRGKESKRNFPKTGVPFECMSSRLYRPLRMLLSTAIHKQPSFIFTNSNILESVYTFILAPLIYVV